MRRLALALMLAAVTYAAASAASTDTSASTSLPFALPATFSGTTMCADCPGIHVTLSLAADGTYALERDYIDRNAKSTENGKWSYDATSGQVRLVPSGAKASPELFALNQSPSLQMLDAQGKPLFSGPDNVLAQVVKSAALEGTEWNLASIGTQPYAPQPGERQASLYFDAQAKRISGSSGCNRIIGPYERSGANGLRIGPLGMTMMACGTHAMAMEGAFTQALAAVASFAIEDGALVLLDRSGAPVARLVAAPSS
jgi:heat shock protein HslJ